MLIKLPIPGGASTDKTDETEGPRWVDMDKVRFQQGYPEKMGGWEREENFSFLGQPSAVQVWVDNAGNTCLAVGTDRKLYVVVNGIRHNITPLDARGTLGTDPFTTQTGSAVIKVAHPNHGRSVNDSVFFAGATGPIDGIQVSELNKEHFITSVNNANEFEVTVETSATAGSMSGGGAAVTYEYELSTGLPLPIVAGAGWSKGNWGSPRASSMGWGAPIEVEMSVTQDTPIAADASLWSFDLWGEDLVACRRRSSIYQWDVSSGVTTRAAKIPNAPETGLLTIVSNPTRHQIVYGANNSLRIAWSDQEDNTVWDSVPTNAAGGHRLPVGDKIQAAIQTRDQILVFTDEAVFGQDYQGPPFIFGFRPLGFNCGVLSQNGAVTIDDIVWWMGPSNFYQYNGQVSIMPCPVRDHVYEDINESLQGLIYGGLNSLFSEVIWLYPSQEATTSPDKYVGFNYKTFEWFFGSLDRCVWNDRQSHQALPIGFDKDGHMYYHESGQNADSVALHAYVESGDLFMQMQSEEMGAGDRLILVDKVVPDMVVSGSLDFSFKTKKYPSAPEITKGPYRVTSSTDKLSFRAKGRHGRIRLESSELGDTWKWREPRYDVRASSRR